jgi:hypothetical protein
MNKRITDKLFPEGKKKGDGCCTTGNSWPRNELSSFSAAAIKANRKKVMVIRLPFVKYE